MFSLFFSFARNKQTFSKQQCASCLFVDVSRRALLLDIPLKQIAHGHGGAFLPTVYFMTRSFSVGGVGVSPMVCL